MKGRMGKYLYVPIYSLGVLSVMLSILKMAPVPAVKFFYIV